MKRLTKKILNLELVAMSMEQYITFYQTSPSCYTALIKDMFPAIISNSLHLRQFCQSIIQKSNKTIVISSLIIESASDKAR